MALVVKNLPANAGEVRNRDLISGSGRSPGGGHDKLNLVFLPQKSHGRRSQVGPWSIRSQRIEHAWNNLACMQFTQLAMSDIYLWTSFLIFSTSGILDQILMPLRVGVWLVHHKILSSIFGLYLYHPSSYNNQTFCPKLSNFPLVGQKLYLIETCYVSKLWFFQ